MLPLFTLMLSLNAPLAAEVCFAPEQGSQKAPVRTSTNALQFAPGQRPGEDEKERNRIKIGISVQQQKQIDDLYNETRAKMDEVRKAIGDLQRKLWDEYGKYDLDEPAIRTIRKELNRQHWRFSEIQSENERKLRTILTREQFDRLRALMKEQWDRRRQEMEQRRRAGRPGGPPPNNR